MLSSAKSLNNTEARGKWAVVLHVWNTVIKPLYLVVCIPLAGHSLGLGSYGSQMRKHSGYLHECVTEADQVKEDLQNEIHISEKTTLLLGCNIPKRYLYVLKSENMLLVNS